MENKQKSTQSSKQDTISKDCYTPMKEKKISKTNVNETVKKGAKKPKKTNEEAINYQNPYSINV